VVVFGFLYHDYLSSSDSLERHQWLDVKGVQSLRLEKGWSVAGMVGLPDTI
jgi:hypothetical protein